MKIITVATQKGGVGKTTLAFNIAKAAADLYNLRTAVIDMEGQANVSIGLTGDLGIKKQVENGAHEIFTDGPFPEPIQTHHGIDLYHGHIHMDRVDGDDDAADKGFSPELRAQIRGLPYDVIVIDTPPTVGLRFLAPLCWATTVVIPTDPDWAGVMGAQDTIEVINNQIVHENKGVKWVGVLNKYRKAVKDHRDWAEVVRKEFGKNLIAEFGDRIAVASSRSSAEDPRPVWKYSGATREVREEWLNFCEKLLA
ncbi:ParA family protein [Paraburkholderia sp. A3RO-2L]|uniref:ParA family protein n=1 Tax=Paraburkholderia sp. A3RO-2L TaxID=3028376 RepID=UPI003DA9CCD3